MLITKWEDIFDPKSIVELLSVPNIKEIANKEKWTMSVDLILKENSRYFHLFARDQTKEYSRLAHCKIKNFPDAVILEINEERAPIFHIIELKKNPKNGGNLEKISQQFMSGYIHSLSYLPFLNINKDIHPVFSYYVVSAEDIVSRNHLAVPEQNIKIDNSEGIQLVYKKIIPGNRLIAKPIEDSSQPKSHKVILRNRVLREWERSKIVFRKYGPNSYEVFSSVKKLHLENIEVDKDETIYSGQLSL